MRSDNISIHHLFNDRQQYLIPLFQRGYVWKLADQIHPLWEDLIDRVDAALDFKVNADKVGGSEKLRKMRIHFLGAIVIGKPKGGSSDTISTREVIDGQQRITTLQILLLAFRDVIKLLEDEALDNDLKNLTHNIGKYREKGHHLKVWPTNIGRDVMQALFELGSVGAVCDRFPVRGPKRARLERPLMVQAYLFFHSLISAHIRGIRFDDSSNEPINELDALLDESLGKDVKEEVTIAETVMRSIENDNLVWTPNSDSPLSIEKAFFLLESLREGFRIISLELDDEEDDPQIIFETLNARGAPLQPSDLIRNFLFLQATRKGEDVDALYNNYWRPFDEKPDLNEKKTGERFWRKEVRQGRLKSMRLDLLLYHYVSLRKCQDFKVAHVFDEFKNWWESSTRNTDAEFRRLTKLAKYFELFLLPNQSSRLGLFCRRMQLLDTSTLTPLVFYFLENHDPESDEIRQILDCLESYVVRRFVCGLTTKSYNRTFTNRLLAELTKEGRSDAASLREKLYSLTGDSQHWPSDPEFEQAWCQRALYEGNSSRKGLAILEALELGLRSSKQEFLPLPNGLTVEHIMPQKWEAKWPAPAATPEAKLDRKRLIHSIGNLTLVTGEFNSNLSNETFAIKRPKIVTTSLLMLNTFFQQFTDQDVWDEKNITSRASFLLPLAKAIWARS